MDREKIFLFLILILGLALRLVGLNQSFWLDEASQAQQSVIPISSIWFDRPVDFHPPLFYFLAHYWLRINRSEVWARLLPVSFGIINILAVYAFAKRIFPKHALIPPLLLAIAPFHVYYSQEFRGYSLLCLLATISMYYFYAKNFLMTSVTNALILYTHYSGIFLIAAQLAWGVFYHRPQLSQFFLGLLLTAAVCLPWVPQFQVQLQAGSAIEEYLPGWKNVLSVSPLKAFPVTLFKLVAGRISFLSKIQYGLYILFVFAVSFAAFAIASHPAKKFFSVWLLIPFFAMLTTSLAIPQNQPFRIIYVLPAMIFLFAAAAIRFPKIFLTLLIYISLVGNVAYYTRPRLQREQWRQAVTFLKASNAVTILKFSAPFAPFFWYAPDFRVVPAVPKFPGRKEEVVPILTPILTQNNRVFLLEYLTELTDPHRVVEDTIKASGYREFRVHNFEGVGFIYEFKKVK